MPDAKGQCVCPYQLAKITMPNTTKPVPRLCWGGSITFRHRAAVECVGLSVNARSDRRACEDRRARIPTRRGDARPRNAAERRQVTVMFFRPSRFDGGCPRVGPGGFARGDFRVSEPRRGDRTSPFGGFVREVHGRRGASLFRHKRAPWETGHYRPLSFTLNMRGQMKTTMIALLFGMAGTPN